MRKQILRRITVLCGLVCLGLFLLLAKPALAANPTTINFQGKVVNSNNTNVTDGTYNFVFRIYNTSSPTPATACSSDSACLFEETQSSVSVTNGTFQVELGSTCSGGLVASNSCTKSAAGGLNFASNNGLYLTLQFSGDTSGTHGGFMWPVIHLTTVPYAYYADNSGALSGLLASNFVQLAQGLQADSSNSNASIAINKTGSSSIVDLRSSNTPVLALGNGGDLTVTPTGANIGATFRQTTGTATSGNVFDIQTASGTSHFFTVSNAAANEGAVTLQSIGATRDLTLDSGSGTLKIGGNSTVLQKSATAFTVDINNASNSTLTLTNAGTGVLALSVEGDITGGGNITAGSGSVYKVGATSGVSQTACGAGQLNQGLAATGGIITTAGSCVNAVTGVGTFSASSQTNGASLSGSNIIFGPADGTNPGMVTASGTQTFGGTKTFSGSVTIQNASGLILGTTSTAGQLSIYNGTNNVVIKGAASTAQYSIVLPTGAGSNNQCLVNTSTPGALQWLACGASSMATVTLAPEFVGAVMSGVGGTNVGTMTSDYCAGSSKFPSGINTGVCTVSTDEHNYYSWTANASNNYDIFVRWSVPQDFASFASGSFNYWKTASGDTVTMNVYNGSSTACATQAASGTTAAWGSQSITMSGCTPSAGGVMTIDIHLAVGTNGNFARIGEITLGYNRN